MEHAQRVCKRHPRICSHSVLILILMEHAQRGFGFHRMLWFIGVLILILMEHAQREGYNWTWSPDFKCLNPYFNGTCSKSSITR